MIAVLEWSTSFAKWLNVRLRTKWLWDPVWLWDSNPVAATQNVELAFWCCVTTSACVRLSFEAS